VENNTPPAAGKGRPKGSPNKIGAAVKDMVAQALEQAHPEGGVAYLVTQSRDNPTAFLTLVGKIIPMQADIKGDLNITEVGWVIRAKSGD
jgi:hypothetical protein